jgi:hypothetical protein
VRKSIGWIGVLMAAAAFVAVTAVPAGAGEPGTAAPLHIRKVLVGPVPPGTQFVVTVACEGNEFPGEPIIFTGDGGSPASSVELVFDAQGNPVGSGDTVTFIDAGTCTVTETQTGGASSVSYECEGSLPPPDGNGNGDSVLPTGGGRFSPRLAQDDELEVCQGSGPQSDPIGVNIIRENQEATVTVTNTFPEPAPEAAVAIVEVPRFTG